MVLALLGGLAMVRPAGAVIVSASAGVGEFTRDVTVKDDCGSPNKRKLEESGEVLAPFNIALAPGVYVQTEDDDEPPAFPTLTYINWNAIVDCWTPFPGFWSANGPIEIWTSNSDFWCHFIGGDYTRAAVGAAFLNLQAPDLIARATATGTCESFELFQTSLSATIEMNILYAPTSGPTDPLMFSAGTYGGNLAVEARLIVNL